jgi:hypothetical protein
MTDLILNPVTTKYIINKEKRTVVCIITTVNEIRRKLEKYGLGDEDLDSIKADVRVYKGIAKCAPEDEWNEIYGKQLAEYRAAKARQNDVNKELKTYVKEMNRRIQSLWMYGCLKTPYAPKVK